MQSPTTEYKHQRKNKAEQANATARLTPPKDPDSYRDGVRCCSQFFLSWFLQPTHPALLYFLQMKSVIDKMYLQKNKQVQPTARSKKSRKKKLPEATLT